MEAKNAALLTFGLDWIGRHHATQGEDPAPGFETARTDSLPMLFAAALIALTSFMPRRLNHYFKPARRRSQFLYLGGVAKLKTAVYVERLLERHHPPGDAAYSERQLDDLAA